MQDDSRILQEQRLLQGQRGSFERASTWYPVDLVMLHNEQPSAEKFMEGELATEATMNFVRVKSNNGDVIMERAKA